MELMSISLDKFYKFVHGRLDDSIPEDILGKITVAVTVSMAYICILICAVDVQNRNGKHFCFNFKTILGNR